MNDIQKIATENRIEQALNVDFTGYEKYLSLLDIAENTRKHYIRKVKDFIEFVNIHGFNRFSFLAYKKHISTVNAWSVGTKNQYLNSARVLCKAMAFQGVIPDITQNVKGFKDTRKHKKQGLNLSEMGEIKKIFDEIDTRSKAILTLLTYQGLRQIEVNRLDVEDINTHAGTAFIQGKGQDGKELIYLHSETLEILKQYITEYNIKSGALFFSLSNNGKNKRLSTRSIRKIIKSIFGKAGINDDKTTHGLRHFFVTELIKAFNGNPFKVKALSRHKSTEMLLVYNDEITQQKDLKKYQSCFQNIL